MKAIMKQRTALLAVVGVLGMSLAYAATQESGEVAIDPDDIGGLVTSAQGPEAGVWVTAETNDLPTRFIRTVVTDNQGRYLLPDLPEANYEVFVRGYGLVDSVRMSARPGQTLNHDAVVAPDPRAAASYGDSDALAHPAFADEGAHVVVPEAGADAESHDL